MSKGFLLRAGLSLITSLFTLAIVFVVFALGQKEISPEIFIAVIIYYGVIFFFTCFTLRELGFMKKWGLKLAGRYGIFIFVLILIVAICLPTQKYMNDDITFFLAFVLAWIGEQILYGFARKRLRMN